MKQSTIECLEATGYPTDVVVLDFESYFSDDYTLSKMSTIEFVTDPRWETLSCGFQVLSPDGDEDPYFVDGPDIAQHLLGLRFKYGENFEKATFVAKNNKFDMFVLHHHYGALPKYTIDIEDLLRFYDTRSKNGLKHVAKRDGLPLKGDTLTFKGWTWAGICLSAEMYTALCFYTMRDIELEVILFEKYLPLVDFTAHEAFMARHTLELFIHPQLEIDEAMGYEILLGMQHQFKKVCRRYDAKMLNSDMQLMARLGLFLHIHGHGEKVPLKKKGKNKKTGKQSVATKNMLPILEQYGGSQPPGVPLIHCGPTFSKKDDGCKWLQAHPDQEIRDLINARIGMKSWPTHMNKMRGMMNQARMNGLHVPLVYFGAHTGRWTGNEAINLLNMGGGGRGEVQHPLISKVRNTIKAPEGRMLSIVDSSQIEARVLAWMAGQQDMTEGFRSGDSPYSALATDIFKTAVWKWDDKTDVEMYTGEKIRVKLYYGFGKDTILGGGYGMGVQRFYDNCLANSSLRPMFDDGTYSRATCENIIGTYRSKYKKIPGFWRLVENAWRSATRYPGHVIKVRFPFTPISLSFYNEVGTTYITLPSGRSLRYHDARVTSKGDLLWRHGTLWGGGITENIDQAFSRDLMTFWIELLEKDTNYDFRVVLHCYDEVVATVPVTGADEHHDRMHSVMCVCPDWAPGLPLGVEGEISERYCK